MKYFKTLIVCLSLLFATNLWAMDMEGTFAKNIKVDGITAQFKVMTLASMNMSDSNGNTHHIMAVFQKDGKNIEGIVGKVKIISPDKKSQIVDLESYPGGNYAAKVAINQGGKWGVICQFKDVNGVHTAKFWYPYHKM